MIKKHYKIDAPAAKVWDAIVDPKKIEEWGGGPVEMSEKVGVKFFLWGGDIYGVNMEVIPEKKLVQDWYGGKWEKPSKVIFTLFSDNDTTTLELEHKDVPENEEESFDSGWDDYYLGAIKDYLEKS